MWDDISRAMDPALLFEAAGYVADPWQADAMRCRGDRLLLLASRQVGKSLTTALIAIWTAIYKDEALVLLFAPSQRQSKELFLKVTRNYHLLGDPVPIAQELTTSLELANGSRIISLPGDSATVRGYSGVDLVVVDEAALVPNDELFIATLPMLATSKGRFILLSTPYGKRGYFHDAWSNGDPTWTRITARASECSRIPPEFLAEQQKTLGSRWYSQEYECNFVDTMGAVFTEAEIRSMFAGSEHPVEVWSDF